MSTDKKHVEQLLKLIYCWDRLDQQDQQLVDDLVDHMKASRDKYVDIVREMIMDCNDDDSNLYNILRMIK